MHKKGLTCYLLRNRALRAGIYSSEMSFPNLQSSKLFFAGTSLSDFQVAYNLRVPKIEPRLLSFILGDLEKDRKRRVKHLISTLLEVLRRSCGLLFGQTTFSPRFLHLESSHLAFEMVVRNSRGHFSLRARFFEMIAP